VPQPVFAHGAGFNSFDTAGANFAIFLAGVLPNHVDFEQLFRPPKAVATVYCMVIFPINAW